MPELPEVEYSAATRDVKPGLIHHSDRGVQYGSQAYTERLRSRGIQISMSAKGNVYDNAKAESFFKTLKAVVVFVKGTAEAGCCLDISKAAHRIGALFDATMILLNPMIERVIAAIDDLISQGLADGTGGGIMPIGRDPLWDMTNHVDGWLKQALGRRQISLLAQHRVHQIAIPIDGSLEIAPLSMDADVRFIDVPRCSCLSASLDR